EVSGDPEYLMITRLIEFGELIGDNEIVQLRLMRKLISEADTVCKCAECDIEQAMRSAFFPQCSGKRLITVRDLADFSPYRFPGLVVIFFRCAYPFESGIERIISDQVEAQPRRE